LRMVKAADITVMAKTVPVRLEKNGLVVSREGREEMLMGNSVVYSGRLTSKNDLYELLKDMNNVINIGDSAEPGRIMDAVWGGFETVRKIAAA